MKTVIYVGKFEKQFSNVEGQKPKALLEIGDMPILWHIMKHYSSYGYNDFILACSYNAYAVKEFFCNYAIHHCDLNINLKNKTTFVKPKFDKLSVDQIPSDLNYESSALEITNGYKIYIDATPKVVDNYLNINFVSFDTNNIWIKIRVLDQNSDVIAESGLVRPGEYLQKIKLDKKVAVKSKITYVIMGYEIDTYFSEGTITLNTMVGE